VIDGTVLGGRYRIGRLLGAGGMGAVHEAVDERLGGVVAVKLLRADQADPTTFERFRREARAAAALGHPHIVRVTDFQENAPEPPFIVMERVEGVSLRQLVARDGRLPPRRACSIAAQILSALAAAHQAGILHRDIKPANVLVMQSPAGDLVKVTDFGIARRLDQADTIRSAGGMPSGHLTGTHEVVGTIGFMAPEQLRGEPSDARADLYAVGATLFEMLSGSRPFHGVTRDEYVAAAFAGAARLDADRLGIDRALCEVVAKAMAPSPADRFSNANAFMTALERWADPSLTAPTVTMPARADAPTASAPLIVLPPGTRTASSDPGGRLVSWMALGGVVVFLLVAALWAVQVMRAQKTAEELYRERPQQVGNGASNAGGQL
jgi:serine/threonine protein kinase